MYHKMSEMEIKVAEIMSTLTMRNVNLSYQQVSDIIEFGKLTNYSGKVRDIKLILNCSKLYDELADNWETKTPLTVPFIKRCHLLLMQDVVSTGAGEIRESKSPLNLLAKIHDMLLVVDYKSETPLENAVMLLGSFEYIKPFGESSKLLSIWLVNYYLRCAGVDYIILLQNEDDLDCYLNCSEKYSRTGDVDIWYDFLSDKKVETGAPTAVETTSKFL